MAWKRLTFLLIPHSRENIKQIGVHRSIIYALSIFLIAAIGIMIFYILGFKGKEFQLSRTRDLVNKNRILNQNLTKFDSSLASMRDRIAHLESTNKSIVEESGISEMDLKRFGDMEMYISSNGKKNQPQRILAIINRLEKESAVFDYNFGVLFEECMKNSDFIRHVPSIRPAYGNITREFGLTKDSDQSRDKLPMTGLKSHPGVDINFDEGTPVVATADGIVEENATTKELGKYIIINHQNGYTTRYAHLQTIPQMKVKIRLKKGDKVIRGQQIGAIGRTGISIPAIPSHLMYSVFHHGIPVNPADHFFAGDFIASFLEETSEAQGQEPHIE